MSDRFLDGKVIARQPDTGFRSGLDAVMLAAAVPARPGDRVLELGAGSGTASLCLMRRVADLDVTGVEIDPGLADLAAENAAANGMAAKFVAADIFALPQHLKKDFEQVFCNPPFHGEDHRPPDPARSRALMDDGTLSQWLRLGLQRTISDGFFTVIVKTDRLSQSLAVVGEEGVSLIPLWPKAGAPAKRMILSIRKNSRAPLVLLPGLVLHEAHGAYTSQAQAVLRDGVALEAAMSGHDTVPTLAAWAGGPDAIARLIRRFYEKVPNDPLLAPIFAGMNPRHAAHVAAFITEVFGGPADYTGAGGSHAGMIGRHLGRHLGEAQRQRWVGMMLETADEVGLPDDPEFRSAFVGYLEWGTRLAVLNSQDGVSPPPDDSPMPQWNWGATGGPYRG